MDKATEIQAQSHTLEPTYVWAQLERYDWRTALKNIGSLFIQRPPHFNAEFQQSAWIFSLLPLTAQKAGWSYLAQSVSYVPRLALLLAMAHSLPTADLLPYLTTAILTATTEDEIEKLGEELIPFLKEEKTLRQFVSAIIAAPPLTSAVKKGLLLRCLATAYQEKLTFGHELLTQMLPWCATKKINSFFNHQLVLENYGERAAVGIQMFLLTSENAPARNYFVFEQLLARYPHLVPTLTDSQWVTLLSDFPYYRLNLVELPHFKQFIQTLIQQPILRRKVEKQLVADIFEQKFEYVPPLIASFLLKTPEPKLVFHYLQSKPTQPSLTTQIFSLTLQQQIGTMNGQRQIKLEPILNQLLTKISYRSGDTSSFQINSTWFREVVMTCPPLVPLVLEKITADFQSKNEISYPELLKFVAQNKLTDWFLSLPHLSEGILFTKGELQNAETPRADYLKTVLTAEPKLQKFLLEQLSADYHKQQDRWLISPFFEKAEERLTQLSETQKKEYNYRKQPVAF